MLRKDKVINGLIVGILLPILGFTFLYQVFKLMDYFILKNPEGFSTNFRIRTLAIVAIALNIFPLRIFASRRTNQSLRGIVIATFVLAMAWLFYFGLKLF